MLTPLKAAPCLSRKNWRLPVAHRIRISMWLVHSIISDITILYTGFAPAFSRAFSPFFSVLLFLLFRRSAVFSPLPAPQCGNVIAAGTTAHALPKGGDARMRGSQKLQFYGRQGTACQLARQAEHEKQQQASAALSQRAETPLTGIQVRGAAAACLAFRSVSDTAFNTSNLDAIRSPDSPPKCCSSSDSEKPSIEKRGLSIPFTVRPH